MKRVVIHRETRLLDDFVTVDAVEYSYQRLDGTISEPVRRVRVDRGDSVAAVVFNRSTQRVILAEQFRLPASMRGDGWMLELAAGVVIEGETPEAAVRREVREEIGYDIERLRYISTFYASPGGSSERIALFMADVTSAGRAGPGGGMASAGEDIRVVEFTLDDIRRLLATSGINDAKTLIGLMWLIEHETRAPFNRWNDE